jgi:hypothetical protein
LTYIPPTPPSSQNDKIAEQQRLIPNIDLDTKVLKEKVLKYLNNISASFISEMCWEIVVSDYELKGVLAELLAEGLIERVPVLPHGEPRLIARVYDQSMKNQAGYENFSKKRWFAITKKGKAVLELL